MYLNKSKLGKFVKSHMVLGGIFLAVMFVACSPLLTQNCINGHDLEYHLLRIESLKEGILAGKPFLKINMLFLGGAGYASSLFYPDFLLYIPAVLRAVGFGINASYHLFVFFCIAMCYASAYFCTKKMTKSRYAALIAAVVLTLCQYHIDDIYTRSAAGEFTAFIFIPFVLYGLYDMLYENLKRPWLMGAGFAGLMLCHTNTLIICLIVYAVAAVCHFKRFVERPVLLLRVIGTAGAVLALTAFYWVPVLEQMTSDVFMVSRAWVSVSDTQAEVSTIFQNELPGMGIAIFLLLIPRLFLKRRQENKKLVRYADLLIVTGILLALSATVLFPWERLQRLVNFIQFPWRLYLPASACLAMASAILFELYFKSRREREYALILLLAVMMGSAAGNLDRTEEGYYSYSDDYFAYKPYTAHIIGGEWLPVSALSVETLMSRTDSAVADTGVEVEFQRIKNRMEIPFEQASCSYIDVPFVYYKGYSADSLDASGKKTASLRVTGEGRNGFCRVYAQGAASGTIVVRYKGTAAQHVSAAVSLVALAGLGVLIYLSRYRGNKSEGGFSELRRLKKTERAFRKKKACGKSVILSAVPSAEGTDGKNEKNAGAEIDALESEAAILDKDAKKSVDTKEAENGIAKKDNIEAKDGITEQAAKETENSKAERDTKNNEMT